MGEVGLGLARRGRAWFYFHFHKGKTMANEYHWKNGFRYANLADANDVQVELERVRKKNDGELSPNSVIDAAKAKRSKLHRFFTWDNSEAAHQYRLVEARRVIQSIEVVRSEAPEVGATREWQTRRAKSNPKEVVYDRMDEVLKDPEARTELLSRALSELLSIRRRYQQLQELSIVFRQLDDLLETLKP